MNDLEVIKKKLDLILETYATLIIWHILGQDLETDKVIDLHERITKEIQ